MHDSQLLGPYSLTEIQELIRSGILSTDDLAQRSETDPWRPLSSILPPKPRVLTITKVILGLASLAFLCFVSVVSCLIYAPLDEWIGFSLVHFDQKAIEQFRLPPNASRVIYYETGFADSATWVAYSADKATLESHFSGLAGNAAQVVDWPSRERANNASEARPKENPVSPPPRGNWRNRGYWKLGPNSHGKYCESNTSTQWVTAYYDIENSRIYYSILTP